MEAYTVYQEAYKYWSDTVCKMTEEDDEWLKMYIESLKHEYHIEVACVRIGYVMGILHMRGQISKFDGAKIMGRFYEILLPHFKNPYTMYKGKIDWVAHEDSE